MVRYVLTIHPTLTIFRVITSYRTIRDSLVGRRQSSPPDNIIDTMKSLSLIPPINLGSIASPLVLQSRSSMHRHPSISSRPRSCLAAKSICTFDESDFAGKQGDWPYTAADLNRLDNSDDSAFYYQPRFVTHIDDSAISYLTKFYQQEFASLSKESLDVLDLCSSWISHLPEDDIKYGNVVGVGMNEKELSANKQLTGFVVQDLNDNPSLSQFEDNSFDVICNVVSVDYLTKPLEMFREMYRILRPGGISLMSFSNRCFPTKAIAMWLQADDIGRLTIVGSYYHYSAKWTSIEALDLKEMLPLPQRPAAGDVMKNPSLVLAWTNAASAVTKNNQGDPMFVVKGVK
jgi:SAM-dependent methyltransferase